MTRSPCPGLTREEGDSLRRVIYRRLGLGVRFGRRLIDLPGFLFYPLFFGLSPLLVPAVRRAASRLNHTARELRYPARFIRARLGRRSRLRPRAG